MGVTLIIQLPNDQMIDEWPGFTVYDAETGDPVDYDFAIDADGNLIGFTDAGVTEVEKEGKFIVQFGDTAKYMRW